MKFPAQILESFEDAELNFNALQSLKLLDQTVPSIVQNNGKSPRLMWGAITPTGTVYNAGSGDWTVSRTVAGTYLVAPPTTFTTAVIAIAGINNAAGYASTNMGFSSSTPAYSFNVFTYSTTDVLTDSYSVFAAVGW